MTAPLADFTSALALAKARFGAHPLYKMLDGTPWANDAPVLAATLMCEATIIALRRASSIATQHADAYEKMLGAGLVDDGIKMKATEARQLAEEISHAD